MNPRDAVQTELKLEPDGSNITIALEIRLHKHAYYWSERGRHLRNKYRLVAPPVVMTITSLDDRDWSLVTDSEILHA